MFTVDNLITDCKKAVAGGRTAQAEVRDILAKAVSAPGQILNELGEPETGGVSKIYTPVQRPGFLLFRVLLLFVWRRTVRFT